MRSRLALLALLAFLTALLAFRIREKTSSHPSIVASQTDRKKNIIRCSPDWNELKGWIDTYDIPLIPGAGIYQWKISTASDSAQVYFNQGINMYYGFHIIEAMASFKKAARFDPGCALLYWAQALGYGPNINDYGYRASPEALEAVSKAVQYQATASPFEKALIDAMTVRYTADSADATRARLNDAYTAKMKQVAERFRDNADAHALYADAMMLQHPWDLWKPDGTPRPWTPLIRKVLENLLVMRPNHPGANHYYIHVMEPSPFADKALPSAARLGTTNPGLSHLVHMPSHIYLRTGNYQQGVAVNIAAVASYNRALPLFAPVAGNDFLYVIHNLHMKTNNAMLSGQYAQSAAAAVETRSSIPADYLGIPPPMGNYVQYIYMTPVLVNIRFGKWEELLKEPLPAAEQVYATLLYHFGRGMARAGQNNIPEAEKELERITQLMKDSSLYLPFVPFSASIEGAKVAERMLRGTIALKRGNATDAIRFFSEAVTTEENMVYDEPRDWMLNPKQYLGNAFLQTGKTREAREVLERDLRNNKENGWALFGIWQSLTREKKTAEAGKIMQRFNRAFDKTAVKLNGPVF